MAQSMYQVMLLSTVAVCVFVYYYSHITNINNGLPLLLTLLFVVDSIEEETV